MADAVDVCSLLLLIATERNNEFSSFAGSVVLVVVVPVSVKGVDTVVDDIDVKLDKKRLFLGIPPDNDGDCHSRSDNGSDSDSDSGNGNGSGGRGFKQRSLSSRRTVIEAASQ